MTTMNLDDSGCHRPPQWRDHDGRNVNDASSRLMRQAIQVFVSLDYPPQDDDQQEQQQGGLRSTTPAPGSHEETRRNGYPLDLLSSSSSLQTTKTPQDDRLQLLIETLDEVERILLDDDEEY